MTYKNFCVQYNCIFFIFIVKKMNFLKSTFLRVLFLGAIVSLNFVKACACIETYDSYHVGIWYYIWPIAVIGVLFLIEALWFRFAIGYKKNGIKLRKAIVCSIIFPAISIGLWWFLVIETDMFDILGLATIFLWFFLFDTIIIKNILKISRLRSIEASIACNAVFLLLMVSTLF